MAMQLLVIVFSLLLSARRTKRQRSVSTGLDERAFGRQAKRGHRHLRAHHQGESRVTASWLPGHCCKWGNATNGWGRKAP